MSLQGNKVDCKHGGTHEHQQGSPHSESTTVTRSEFQSKSNISVINSEDKSKGDIQNGGSSKKELFSTSDSINIPRNLNLCNTNSDLALESNTSLDERKKQLILESDDSMRIDEQCFSPKSLSVQSLDKIFDWQGSTLSASTQDNVMACLEELERGSQLSQEEKEMLENSKKELQALELREEDRNNTLMTPQELENMPEQGIEFEESVGPKDVLDNEINLHRSPSPITISCIAENLISETSESSLTKSPDSNILTNFDSATLEKLDPTMTTISIASNKSNNTTHILINTLQGQQLFEINTSSLLQATAELQPLPLSNNAPAGQDTSSRVFEATINANLFRSEENAEIEAQGLILLATSKPGEYIVQENVGSSDLANALQVTVTDSNKTSKNQEFVCPTPGCNKIYEKQCKLKVHMMIHTGERPFKCDFAGCDWAFTSGYKLKRHMESHEGKKEYECLIDGCKRKFTTIYNLNAHKRLHERPDIAICSVESCNMKFPTKRQLDIHLKQHEGVQAPYKCAYEGCTKVFYSSNSLGSHLRIHLRSEDDLKCPVEGCGKVFDKSCRLKIHIWQHTGERPYVCDSEGCGWNFTSASKLTRHMRKHTGERNFVCPEEGCGKCFRRQEHLKGHLISHSGIKPFQCTYENCTASFTARSSLYVHSKKHHAGEKIVYHCPFDGCEKKYNSKTSLKQHVLKQHTRNRDLDYIAFLKSNPEFSDMPDMEVLTKASDEPPANVLSVSSVSSVDGQQMPPFTRQDSSLASPMDYVSAVDPHLVSSSAFESDVITQHVGNNVVTQFVVNDDLPSPHSLSNRMTAEVLAADLDCSSISFQDAGTGSARTDSHSNHILSDRARKRRLLQQQAKLGFSDDSCLDHESTSKLCVGRTNSLHPTDVVLTSTAITFRDPATGTHYVQTQLLQDDPPNPDLYHDDTLLTPVASNQSVLTSDLSVSILQEAQASEQNSDFVSPSNSEFTGTTINLQDLE